MTSLLKRQAITGAVVCFLVAAALGFFFPLPAQWVFLGLGVVLLLLSLVLNAREARTAMGTRTARYGAGAALMVAARARHRGGGQRDLGPAQHALGPHREQAQQRLAPDHPGAAHAQDRR